MKFATLAAFALVSNVSAVELHNQAHAKGLKAPHQVKLAQGYNKENRDWGALAGQAAAMANNHFNGA